MSLPKPREFRGTERFALTSLLGRGAYGIVYSAFDREHGATVALKVLVKLSPEAIARFKNEFRALQDLRHENLVELKELLFADDCWFLTMELVQGVDFLSYVRRLEPRTDGLVESGIVASPSDETLRPDVTQGPSSGDERLLGTVFDERRLRSALSALTDGLLFLHRAGKVHRDIKPSNVLVDDQGRVVVLDFGLVAEVDVRGEVPREELVGTPRYMAPEQATLRRVNAASDWYSVGVLLHEALTGQLPSERTRSRSALAAPSPLEASEIPRDLAALCLELLATDPSARPSGYEVRRRLGTHRTRARTSSAPLGAVEDAGFVGRALELGMLREALERVRVGDGACVIVEGESGVGKTALVREFIARERARELGIQCFAGRCFEREALPFKAIDGVMDAICAHMAALSTSEISKLLGGDGPLMARPFSAFQRFLGVAATAGPDELQEPHAHRARVFAALRGLLGRLSSLSTTIVWIDDMHWSDLDSLALLSTVLQPPMAPGLLLLVTTRPGGPLERVRLPDATQRWSVGNLPPEDATTLAASLLAAAGGEASPSALCDLVRDAGGHPLFVRELVRKLGALEGTAGPVRLQDALRERIVALEPDARLLLELAAAAGRPIAQGTAADALWFEDASPITSGVDPNDHPALARIAGHLTSLRHACLIRTTGAHPNDTLEVYHDRIRDAVTSQMHADARQRHHRALALALTRTGTAEPEALANHWDEAGESQQALDYVLAAAERARAALAFEQAARLYKLAMARGGENRSDAARRDLESKLAESLANAGRGVEAAKSYENAGRGDDSLLGLHRQRLAGEQLLRSGRVGPGIDLVWQVLAKLGVRPPRRKLAAFGSLLVLRLALWLKGFSHRAKGPVSVSARELARIDGLWMAATCLMMFDNVQSAELQCRATLRALSAGSPFEVLRAHTAEALFVAYGGKEQRPRIDALLDSARVLAASLADPYARGLVALSDGVSSFLLGEWARGEAECGAAEAIFARRAGAHFELSSARAWGTWAAMMRGDFRRVMARVTRFLEEAEQRGDEYAATLQMTGFSNAAWLAMHDVASARRMLACADERWPGRLFDVPRYLNMIAAAHIELYEGNGTAAYARVVRDWASLRWGIAFRSQITRFGMRFIRGLTALAAYDATHDRALLRDAAHSARAIAAERVLWSGCFSDLLEAGVASRRGEQELAVRSFERAEDKAARTGMTLHRAVARHRRGELIGGELGSCLMREADAFMRAQDIVQPSQVVDMLSPRVPVLTALQRRSTDPRHRSPP